MPIYLVSPSTIGHFSTPEHVGLDPACLREALAEIDERIRWEALERRGERGIGWVVDGVLEGCPRRRVALLGCYVSEVSETRDALGDATPVVPSGEGMPTRAPSSGPAIFLCPERIFSYPKGDLLFQKVLIHELVHAYRGADKRAQGLYERMWGRIIEESLASAIAFLHLQPRERGPMASFMAAQPPEYAAYVYWLRLTPEGRRVLEGSRLLKQILAEWRDGPRRAILPWPDPSLDWPDWVWLFRHFPERAWWTAIFNTGESLGWMAVRELVRPLGPDAFSELYKRRAGEIVEDGLAVLGVRILEEVLQTGRAGRSRP